MQFKHSQILLPVKPERLKIRALQFGHRPDVIGQNPQDSQDRPNPDSFGSFGSFGAGVSGKLKSAPPSERD